MSESSREAMQAVKAMAPWVIQYCGNAEPHVAHIIDAAFADLRKREAALRELCHIVLCEVEGHEFGPMNCISNCTAGSLRQALAEPPQ